MTTQIGSLTFDDDTGSAIAFERSYAVPPERLWRAIATKEGLSGWLADGEFEGREGGAVRFEFNEDQTVTGEILVWDPYSELTHTWNINGEIPSTLNYRIHETATGSTLTLTHTKLPAEMAGGYTPGWHAYLDRLGQSLRGSDVQTWDELFERAMPLYMPTD
jgi:uncharacterized protein YndB with AHSA1/START domain